MMGRVSGLDHECRALVEAGFVKGAACFLDRLVLDLANAPGIGVGYLPDSTKFLEIQKRRIFVDQLFREALAAEREV